MKREKPKFNHFGGEVGCSDCPFDASSMLDCADWMRDHEGQCPTAETYAEACRIAEGKV